MSGFFVLTQIAIRNLFANFLNLFIGGIIVVGTLFFVVGGSFLNSVDSAMSKSITGSIAGHIQVYSNQSKEELTLFGDWGFPDIAAIPDFSKVKQALQGISNIQTIIPMGVNGASVMFGNTVDLTLERLRKSVSKRAEGDHSPETQAQIQSLKSHVQQIVKVIQGDYKKLAVLASEKAIDPQSSLTLEKAASSDFWNSFDRDPFGHLEFLENQISSLIPDADLIYLGYAGTDVDSFSKSFDRMEVVDGQPIPSGKRGMLLSKYIYENQFKLKIAHRLDQINEALTEQSKKIATDPDLQLMVKQNRTQTRELVLQLDPLTTQKVVTNIQGFLKSEEKDLHTLLNALFDTNDENFAARYQFFYDSIAPLIELYRVRPGDSLTIKAFTKSGFVQSANIKVYGTFQFKGLEKSGLAGGLSLMDLMSFRDLYGFVTPDKIAEAKQMQASVGAKVVERDQAEAELFGGSSAVTTAKERAIDDRVEMGNGKLYDASAMINRAYSTEEIERGVALNAAIILKDPSKLEETMKTIDAAAKREGLDLRVVSWQKAAGNIGQFVFVAKVVLYFAVFIIFIVALVVINNAIMMATLQRIREIGTMRAIGAQRSFVLSMVLVETMVLGVVFGSIGILLGAGVVQLLASKGIPAPNEFLYFFFSGPRLFISLSMGSLIGAVVVIGIVTAASALYPAIIATRVSPVQAMQSED